MTPEQTRRAWIATGAALIAGNAPVRAADDKKKDEPEVTATEDLMREHGVIRRALLVYHEAAARLRRNPSSVDAAALQQTAHLFREFGEDYHEKKLEEAHIFPAVRKVRGEAAKYPDILVAQHNRGREITSYILAVTKAAKVSASNAEPLAVAMDGLVRMYENHAAREDTIVFPAWKKTMPAHQLEEMGDKFEQIEHQQFGKDGFDDAEERISRIEATLGLSDLAQFTPPSPGRPKA